MPVRAGWVPCVGFQPLKPMMMVINEADAIASECERAFRMVRPEEQQEELAASSSGAGGEMLEDEGQRPLEKPPMKLLMNPKGVQDFQAVQEHYENLMNAAPTSPDVGKVMLQSPVLAASPSGKGAELFAKRKKRMDKFIVDETTVQKAQQQTTSTQQTSSFSSSFSSSSKSVSSSSSSSFTSMKQAEMERNRQQEQIMFAAPPMGGAPTAPAAAPASGTGAIYTAEVKVVQRASLPPTPVDVPQHSLLDLVSQESSVNKRRSLNFNLAAKGFGTYNNFYTPVSFAT